MTILEVFHILEQIQETKSTTEKQDILREYNSPEMIELLEAALNPYRRFFIRKKVELYNIAYDHITLDDDPLQGFRQLLHLLETRAISGKQAENTVYKFMERRTPFVQEWFYNILLKKAIGLKAKTVNKTFGKKIIPQFDLMLAPSENANLDELVYPVIMQPKLDGFRAIHIPDGGIVGRSGNFIKNKEVQTKFSNAFKEVVDGELYIHGVPFETLESIFNKEDAPLPPSAKFVAFDGMPFSCWQDQQCSIGYEDRLNSIEEQVACCLYYEMISYEIVLSAEEAMKYYLRCIEQGYEGAMVKDPHGLYMWKRGTVKEATILKMKPSDFADLYVTGFEQSTMLVTKTIREQFIHNFPRFSATIMQWELNQPAPIVGSLICDYDGHEQHVSNMPDQERIEWFIKPDMILNKWIMVKYMEKTEYGKLRHPRFKSLRDDK